MPRLVLGLDLGPNSVGWALVEDDPQSPAESQLVDLGVRVFPEGVDAFDKGKEKSRNESRRIARGMRRQIRRRVRRRKILIGSLIEAGLWPASPDEQAQLYQQDPYRLRARAVREKLSLHEIGRVLLHLNQRRGFLSNRKRDRGDKEVKGMLAEINENERERREGEFETVGAWLATKTPPSGKSAREFHTRRRENDHVRGRHLARSQYEEEFEAIWNTQSGYHKKQLTDLLKFGSLGKQTYPRKSLPRPAGESRLESFGIHGLLFFQRPMYWPKSVVGLCELEPKQKRCPRSDRRYQRFRLLQEVNNLKYADSEAGIERPLTDGQRNLLLEKLSRTREMTFDQIRKALGFLDSIKFNLERGKRTKLQGAPVDALFAAGKVLGKSWHNRPDEEKTEIVAVLIDNERDDDAIVQRAVSEWNMTPAQAEAILNVDLMPGYGNLSLLALKKLLPHMEKGLLYMADDDSRSALHAAGYLRRDQLQRRIFDHLPDPKRTPTCPIGDIPNPVVKRTLTEVRRVVNAIIREHGKPDAIHVEMARAVQQGKQRRNEYSKMIRAREAERDAAATVLREHGIRVNRENILRYLLWQQQGTQCIYSGKPIGRDKLFSEGGGVEVDHILPRSRTLDDSQANKIICLRSANQGKGKQTPYEWLAETNPEQYAQVCQRAGKLLRDGRMTYAKYRRFIQKELDLSTFINRQLADTRYIARATAEYLRCLFERNRDHEVIGLKGQLTAELRRRWGLDTVLQELSDSPGWQDEKAGKLRFGEKNRADHRHHAIDALVVALTNRNRLQQLSKIVKRGRVKQDDGPGFEPWPGFRNNVKQRIAELNVSHRVERKVHGALHEETLYGPTPEEGQWAVRKSVVDLSPSEIGRIRDKALRHLVEETLAANGIKFGRGKKPDRKMKAVLGNLTMKSGVPVRKLRLNKPEKTVRPVREGKPGEAWVKPGSTHHLCIFEWEENGKTKRDAVFVTMLEAMERIKRQKQELARRLEQWTRNGADHNEIRRRKGTAMSEIAAEFPVIDRQPPADCPDIPAEARFVMSLSGREMVLAEMNGQTLLLSYKTAVSTTKQIRFAEHTDARKDSDYKKYSATPNTLRAQKVTVDPLGRIRNASD